MKNATSKFYLIYTFSAKYWDTAPKSGNSSKEIGFSLTRTPASLD